MRTSTPARYALWSLLAIVPMLFLLVLHSSMLLDPPGLEATDVAPMTAFLAAVALLMAAFLAPGIVDPESKSLPGWTFAIFAACIAQMLVLLVSVGDGTSSDAWSQVYLPSAMVILDLTVLIIVHAWVAAAKFGFHPAVGLATGGACAAWTFHAGSATAFGAFHAVSSIALVSALAVGIAVALTGLDVPATPR